jgi:hypothetical protein
MRPVESRTLDDKIDNFLPSRLRLSIVFQKGWQIRLEHVPFGSNQPRHCER